MAIIISQIDDAAALSVVSGIINATGRDVIFRASSGLITCPTCGGNDPFCATCSGNATIDQPYDYTQIASVRWKESERKSYKPQGQAVEGDCTIVLAYNTLLETVLKQTRTVVVDNRACTIRSYKRAGYNVNRMYVVLNEDESYDGYRIG